MGCAASRLSRRRRRRRRCEHCRRTTTYYSPVHRSYSLHTSQRRAAEMGDDDDERDGHHVVSLRSSTLGWLEHGLGPRKEARVRESSASLDRSYFYFDDIEHDDDRHVNGREEAADDVKKKKTGFEIGLFEAKAWSKLIDEKINRIAPMTPIRTPTGEPEKINAWEMMEGLENTSPLHPLNYHQHQTFTPNHSLDSIPAEKGFPSDQVDNDSPSNTDLIAESADSDFDPELMSLFRKAFQDLPPAHPFHLGSFDHDQDRLETNGTKVDEAVDYEKVHTNRWNMVASTKSKEDKEMNGVAERKMRGGLSEVYGVGAKKRVVLYFTSLRGVRKTYEDCCHVRIILKSLGVRVDERDVSMHSGFKEELRELLGADYSNGGLPRLFARGKYIGGADEIRQMHEDGELKKVLEGFRTTKGDSDEGDGGLGTCDACGDIRFVPCQTCSGSCKIYYEGDDEFEGNEEDWDESECGFQRCPDCNENGLVRCPICCDY